MEKYFGYTPDEDKYVVETYLKCDKKRYVLNNGTFLYSMLKSLQIINLEKNVRDAKYLFGIIVL